MPSQKRTPLSYDGYFQLDDIDTDIDVSEGSPEDHKSNSTFFIWFLLAYLFIQLKHYKFAFHFTSTQTLFAFSLPTCSADLLQLDYMYALPSQRHYHDHKGKCFYVHPPRCPFALFGYVLLFGLKRICNVPCHRVKQWNHVRTDCYQLPTRFFFQHLLSFLFVSSHSSWILVVSNPRTTDQASLLCSTELLLESLSANLTFDFCSVSRRAWYLRGTIPLSN